MGFGAHQAGRQARLGPHRVWVDPAGVSQLIWKTPNCLNLPGADYFTSTRATRFAPLQASTRFPLRSGIMLRTTPPPDGMIQV